MNWIAQTCLLAFGWRRILLMVMAGAVAALSMPPLFFLPALFFAMPLWVWCLDGAERKRGWLKLFGPAFQIGFSFGLGYFSVSLHWIGTAFFVDGGWTLALMPLAILALAAMLSLFWGLASALAHLFWSHSFGRIFILTSALSIAEYARGHLFSGFPFDVPGYALTANETMMQLASLVGIYGLTFLAFLMSFLPALVWPADQRPLNIRLAPMFAVLAILAGQLVFGQFRLRDTPVDQRRDMRLRLVQPGVSQIEKWQPGSSQKVLQRLMDLSRSQTGPNDTGLIGITHLIWPEAALPFFLPDFPQALVQISRLLPPGTTLLTGAPRREQVLAGDAREFNSILMINSDGEIVASYDKTHLVPVGEYLPFEKYLAPLGLKQFVSANKGWSQGETPRLLRGPTTPPFVPLICYEAIFSADLGPGANQAEFILNLTNDAWFDGSIGPEQHFHHARVRAVEQGLSMVRAANSGKSAAIDPLGRIVASMDPGETGVIDFSMPESLGGTFFSRYLNGPFFLLVGMAALLGAFASRKRSRP